MAVKHRGDQDALCIYCVEREVREAPEKHAPRPKHNDLSTFRMATNTLHGSLERQQELESKTESPPLIPMERAFELALRLREQSKVGVNRPDSSRRFTSSQEAHSAGFRSCSSNRRSASARCASVAPLWE